MDPEIQRRIAKAKERLSKFQVPCVQPQNPYCFTAVLMGTVRQMEIGLNFWKGEPESLEFYRRQYPLKLLPRAGEAVQKAMRIVEEFPL